KLWEAYLAQARASRSTQRRGQHFEGLAAVRKALELPVPPGRTLAELRNEALACLALPDLEVAREWQDRPGTQRITLDRAFERYARADGDGNVSVHGL